MPLPPDEGWAIPFDAPFYPPLPATYRNVTFQQVFFRADPAAVARFLPDPLEPSPDGLCIATGIRIPFSSAYGPINEAMIELKAVWGGRSGWFCSRVWHNGPRGIAAGREIYGTPKVYSTVESDMRDGAMVTRASMAGIPVITVATTTEAAIDPADLPAVTPSWLLKIIARADGPGPAIRQLVDASEAGRDAVVHAAFRGRGTVAFEPSPFGDFTWLRPLEYGPAFVFESSYTETFAAIARDELAPSD